MSRYEYTESARQAISDAARDFLTTAFASLEKRGVLPPPRFKPYLAVGQDYYADELEASAESHRLEGILEEAFPERFDDPLKRRHAEFASIYVFRLLETAIAMCALRRESFRTTSPAVDEAISALIDRLATRQAEVVCCRFVSHVASISGEEIAVEGVTLLPLAKDHSWRDDSIFRKFIPGAGQAFDHEPPFVHDHPHAVLVARGAGADPYQLEDEVSAKIDRFLLILRLLYASTAQSYFEVRGESSWVGTMQPHLVMFLGGGTMGPMMRRTVRLGAEEVAAAERLSRVLQDLEVDRKDMAATSWDVAINNFSRASTERAWPEQLISLATALEAVLAGTDKDDVTLRLRVRAAALLATDTDSGSTVFGDVGTLYAMRSRLVHGANIKERDVIKFAQGMSTVSETHMHGLAVAQAVARARDLVRRALLARLCLASGDEPLWPLAGTTPVDALLADDGTRAKWRATWHQKMHELGSGAAAREARAAADWLSEIERE
jgi:hypothetical protein